MKPFETIRSVAACLPEANVDTDTIFPARFLLLLDRDGLGRYAFHDRRFDSDRKPVPEFVLNRPPFDTARILIAGDGFGCGSSREQAVWALAGFGIGCVIAPGFGEIFHANCLKNGVLPVRLPQRHVDRLADRAQTGAVFTVDLGAGSISIGDEQLASIDLAESQRQALLNGWDETDQIVRADGPRIDAFEAAQRETQPWLYEREEGL